MNWSGRPLTSHEVIVQSIAATTTRTGLRVTAELDTDTYPTGVRVADAEMAALSLTRHAFHGDWNYALHPQPSPSVPAARIPQTPEPEWDQSLLFDPALTGMTRRQLSDLTETLAPDGDTQRGHPPRLTFPEQVLATVLHLRAALAAEPLTVLFDTSRTAMHRTLLKNRRLLDHPTYGPRHPPSPDPGADQRGQQDQDNVLVICKPLGRREALYQGGGSELTYGRPTDFLRRDAIHCLQLGQARGVAA